MNKDELYRKIEVLSKLIETSEGEVLMQGERMSV